MRKFCVFFICVVILATGVSCYSDNPKDKSDEISEMTSSVTKEETEVQKSEEEIAIDDWYEIYSKGTEWFTETERDWLIEATFDFKQVNKKTVIFQYVDDVEDEDYFYYYYTNYREDKTFEHIGYVYNDLKLYSFAHYRDYIIYESFADCTKSELEDLQSDRLLEFGNPLSIEDAIEALDFEKRDINSVEVVTEDNYNYEVYYYLDNKLIEEWITKEFSTVNQAKLDSVKDIYVKATIGDFLGGNRVYFSFIGGTLIYEMDEEKIETQVGIDIHLLDNKIYPYSRLDIFKRNLRKSEYIDDMLTTLWKDLDRRKNSNPIYYY